MFPPDVEWTSLRYFTEDTSSPLLPGGDVRLERRSKTCKYEYRKEDRGSFCDSETKIQLY